MIYQRAANKYIPSMIYQRAANKYIPSTKF